MNQTMDTPTNDGELLRSWLDAGKEEPFRRLVDRYAGLVRQSALRTSGDPAIADEASQNTFILLARKARSLQSRASLAGWLHTTACLQTRNLLRSHRREHRKRHALHTMNTPPQEEHSQAWRDMAPVLDDALASLRDEDREAILLRFYRSLPLSEVAAAFGIASDAARKRVDRAVERLRSQLERRGCTLGTTSCIGALTHFGTDAQAALTSAPLLASSALKAAALAPTSLTATAIIIMTKKATITATAALLLAGAGAVVLMQNKEDTAKAGSETSGTPARPDRPAAFGANADSENDAANRARPRDPAENPEFVSKYGEARTNLSKFVAGNIVGLLEDAVSMAEMASTGQLGGFGGGRMGIRAGLGGLYNELQLNEEQETRAAELYKEFQAREIERSKASIAKLKEDPTALMQLMLASDAFKRGEITEDEYKELQTKSGTDLEGVMNPLDRNNFRGGQPLGDDAFVDGFKGILDPTQAGALQAKLDEQATADDGSDPGNITNLPAMELEQLDKAVTSGKTITSGLKQMMEGIGGLQELGPLLEQQNQNQGGGENPAPEGN
jgi:RNA polymerase sigma factor (sigma-70 family)